jgi:hypothetical protein
LGGFREEELYGSEEILRKIIEKQEEIRGLSEILVERAEIDVGLLEKVTRVVDHQALNIFVYILKNTPVSRRRIKMEFPSSTVDRYLPQLEAAGAIIHRGFRYWIKR